jgi:hypothetical protein
MPASFHFPIFQFRSSTTVTAKDAESVVENERQVLRALCQDTLATRARLNTLRSYCWREPLHQVIFDFLISMPSANPELMREQLPAHLTRRGFPDFDLTCFQPNTLAGKDVERLIERLKNLPNPATPPESR